MTRTYRIRSLPVLIITTAVILAAAFATGFARIDTYQGIGLSAGSNTAYVSVFVPWADPYPHVSYQQGQ